MKPADVLICLFLILFFAACKTTDTGPDISVKTDILVFNNTNDTLIFGSKGTALFFEKESFVLPDGSEPKGDITIQLKECYDISDIVRENLSTTSNGKLLETRGMINVKAYAGNQELQLRTGKRFIIHFPKDTLDKKPMNLFYGKRKENENIDWSLDSATLLRPTAYMTGWLTHGHPFGDTTKGGFYFKGDTATDIYTYFYKNFDNSKLEASRDSIGKLLEVKFTVTTKGKITNLRIVDERYDSSGKLLSSRKIKADPYFYEYIRGLPAFEPFQWYNAEGIMAPFDTDCSFYITIGLYPPDYQSNESYNKHFYKKYRAFRDSTIVSMNDAELKYFVFSSSKLGWINCDYFWQTTDERIDYYVKVDAASKPNINLVFKQARSIMPGELEGDKYVFKNVPVNQDVKIVAISYQNKQPLLAVTETKTSKNPLEKLDYKEFSITELEKQLNGN